MWGLIAIIVFVIGYFIFSCRNSAEDSRSKQNAKDANQKYYLDWEGKKRRIDNDHQFLQHVTDYRTGDKVDLDMKTNEVLRNYSQEERVHNQIEAERYRKEGLESKEKSLREGYYTYHVKERHVDEAVLASLLPWTTDVERERRTVSWEYVNRRVSDDLLVRDEKVQNDAFIKTEIGRSERNVCIDAQYKFRLYEYSEKARTSRNVLRDDDKYNRWLCSYLIKENKVDMTEEELFAYAKSIGAIFVGQDN